MKAVILAAGKGRRMLPLTLTIPKPLLRIGNKTILDHIFDAFPEEIDQVIIVVGYLKKKIQQHLGIKYQGRTIRYVVQDILDGSATALLCCQDFFLPKEKFLLVYGDELPTHEEFVDCLQHQYSWLCSPSHDPRQSGIAMLSNDQQILEVIEKPENPVSNLSAAGIMVVDSYIFNYKLIQHRNGEYYLTSLMNQFVADHKVHAVLGSARPSFISPDEVEKLHSQYL